MRGTSLASGAKALVVKAGDKFVLIVLPADRKLDSKKAREAFGVKALRFASKEEVEQLTGLQPGSIPPFGSLFGLPTYCDPALAGNPVVLATAPSVVKVRSLAPSTGRQRSAVRAPRRGRGSVSRRAG